MGISGNLLWTMFQTFNHHLEVNKHEFIKLLWHWFTCHIQGVYVVMCHVLTVQCLYVRWCGHVVQTVHCSLRAGLLATGPTRAQHCFKYPRMSCVCGAGTTERREEIERHLASWSLSAFTGQLYTSYHKIASRIFVVTTCIFIEIWDSECCEMGPRWSCNTSWGLLWEFSFYIGYVQRFDLCWCYSDIMKENFYFI